MMREEEKGLPYVLKYMLSEEVQLKLALETDRPLNPNVDLVVIREGIPLLGNALEQAHAAADIRLRRSPNVWNSGIMETIGADIRLLPVWERKGEYWFPDFGPG